MGHTLGHAVELDCGYLNAPWRMCSDWDGLHGKSPIGFRFN